MWVNNLSVFRKGRQRVFGKRLIKYQSWEQIIQRRQFLVIVWISQYCEAKNNQVHECLQILWPLSEGLCLKQVDNLALLGGETYRWGQRRVRGVNEYTGGQST